MAVVDRTEREARNGDTTVREIIAPWDVQPAKGDARARAANAAEETIEDLSLVEVGADDAPIVREAPPSGIRMSEPEGEPVLTYRVYTLADLDPSPCASRSFADLTASRGPSHLVRVRVALVGFVRALREWLALPRPRQHPFVALRAPFDVLGDELQAAVQAVDWKKVGVTTGTAVGTALALLFAVLTVAELTDDLKPAAATRLAATETVGPPAPPAPVHASPIARVVPSAPAPAAAAEQPVIEVDEPSDVSEVKKPKKNAGPRSKTSKLTFRNANEVFSP